MEEDSFEDPSDQLWKTEDVLEHWGEGDEQEILVHQGESYSGGA